MATIDGMAFTQTCVCGRSYTDIGAFTRHEKGCRKGMKRLSSALAKAKEIYHAKKARRRGPSQVSFAVSELANGFSLATGASDSPQDLTSSDLQRVRTVFPIRTG